MTDQVLEIIQERGEVYGNSKTFFPAFGKAITALLEAHYEIKLSHDIPEHVAVQIMVLLKGLRAVRQHTFQLDNYLDEEAYVQIALSLDKREFGDE